MRHVDLKVKGCDDTTHVLDIEVSHDERDFLVRIVGLVNAASDASCQPTMAMDYSPAGPPGGAACEECWGELGDDYRRTTTTSWVHAKCHGVES